MPMKTWTMTTKENWERTPWSRSAIASDIFALRAPSQLTADTTVGKHWQSGVTRDCVARVLRAAVGLYGVRAYTVERRTRRLACGWHWVRIVAA